MVRSMRLWIRHGGLFSLLGVSLRRCPRTRCYRRLLQRERRVSRLGLYERDLEWCNIAGRSRSSKTAFWEASGSIELAKHILLSCGLILAIGTVTGLLAQKIQIPDVAVFLIVGMASGP